MKHLFILLLSLHVLHAQDKPLSWRDQNGMPVANTESRKSVENFGAFVLITSDADWQKKWNTPASETPRFTEIHKLRRGEKAWVLIFFANPQQNDDKWVDVKCDIKITRPNGKVTENKGVNAMRLQLEGPATSTFMAEPVIGFLGEESDPLGDWLFEVTLHDLNRKVSIPVKTKFTLVEKDA
jgi:hypothetical protein